MYFKSCLFWLVGRSTEVPYGCNYLERWRKVAGSVFPITLNASFIIGETSLTGFGRLQLFSNGLLRKKLWESGEAGVFLCLVRIKTIRQEWYCTRWLTPPQCRSQQAELQAEQKPVIFLIAPSAKPQCCSLPSPPVNFGIQSLYCKSLEQLL